MPFVLSKDRALRTDFYHIFEADDVHGLLVRQAQLILLFGGALGLVLRGFVFAACLLSTGVELLPALNLVDDLLLRLVSA